jgi:hypothetical protein
MREAVTPADIIAWAAVGQLPFFELPAFAADAGTAAAGAANKSAGGSAVALAPLPALCVTPQIWDTPSRLASHARALASALGLQLPPVNGEALLRRAALELGVPPAVCGCAQQLLRVHLVGRAALELPRGRLKAGAGGERAADAASPYAAVMAWLLVAAKVMYGIGATSGSRGSGNWPAEGSPGACAATSALPGAPPPPPSWTHWAAAALRRLELARGGIPGSPAQVRGAYPARNWELSPLVWGTLAGSMRPWEGVPLAPAQCCCAQA